MDQDRGFRQLHPGQTQGFVSDEDLLKNADNKAPPLGRTQNLNNPDSKVYYTNDEDMDSMNTVRKIAHNLRDNQKNITGMNSNLNHSPGGHSHAHLQNSPPMSPSHNGHASLMTSLSNGPLGSHHKEERAFRQQSSNNLQAQLNKNIHHNSSNLSQSHQQIKVSFEKFLMHSNFILIVAS